MARKVATANGHDRLEDALATLIQNQAALVQNQAALVQNQAAFISRMAEADQRFARIEQNMATIIGVLNEHGRLLERLPEAVREKIGFKS